MFRGATPTAPTVFRMNRNTTLVLALKSDITEGGMTFMRADSARTNIPLADMLLLWTEATAEAMSPEASRTRLRGYRQGFRCWGDDERRSRKDTGLSELTVMTSFARCARSFDAGMETSRSRATTQDTEIETAASNGTLVEDVEAEA